MLKLNLGKTDLFHRGARAGLMAKPCHAYTWRFHLSLPKGEILRRGASATLRPSLDNDQPWALVVLRKAPLNSIIQ